MSEDESPSKVRLNKNDIPGSENVVGLFLYYFNNFTPSFNYGRYVLKKHLHVVAIHGRPFPEA